MAKLRFDNLTLGQFNFNLVPKKRKINTNSDKKLTSNLVKGICFKDEEGFKIKIDAKILKPDIIDKGQPDLLILNFTEESYDLRGVVSVFDKNPDKNCKYVRYIRNESQCKFFPGSKEKLVPFCPNWICSGYIVRREGKMLFKFNECIAPKGYDTFNLEENEKL